MEHVKMMMIEDARRRGVSVGYSPAREIVARLMDVVMAGEVTRLKYIQLMLDATAVDAELFDRVCPDRVDMENLTTTLKTPPALYLVKGSKAS